MPIVDIAPRSLAAPMDTPAGFAVTPGKVDIDHGSDAPDTSWARGIEKPALQGVSEAFGAAFRQDNLVGSFFSSPGTYVSNDPEPGFNPWDKIKGTKDEANWESFVDVRNSQRFDAVKRQLDQEAEDKKTLEAAPWYVSVPAQLSAGVLDLPTLLPGGAFVRSVKGGYSVGRSALSVGMAAGAATTAQEAGLQAIQEKRSLAESGLNVGASVLLGGLIGAGGARLLSKAEWSQAVTDLERGMSNPTPVPESTAPQAAGAAAATPTDIDGNSVAGMAAGAISNATAQLNPALRALNSPSAAYRDIATNLFENSVYLNKNLEGGASAPAVETLMREWNAGLAKSIISTNEAFSNYVKRNGGSKLAEQFPSRYGLMTRQQFREEVGRSMRRGDESEIPEVAEVAKAWRSQVFDPLKEAAIKAKLLPEDVSVDTAMSYFSRMWNRNKLIAREGRFKQIVTDYYHGELEKDFAKSIQAHTKRVARLDQEMADLQLGREERLVAGQSVEAELASLETNAPMMERVDKLDDLKGASNAALKAGDKKLAASLRKEAKAMLEENEGELADFVERRSNLRVRSRNIERGVVGMEDRSQALLDRLADVEESNFRAMERLIKKGQKLERDLDRLDADALEDRVTALTESYSNIARKAEASAERAKRQIANINKRAAAKEAKNIERGAEIAAESDAKIKARLEIEAERQAKLAERMDKLAERLKAAREFDHDGLLDEIRSGVVKAAREASAGSMAKGERATKLGERLQAANPEKVIKRVAALAEKRKEMDGKFIERWEIGRGATDVDPAARSAQFTDASRQIADEVFNSLTGRVEAGMRPEFITIKSRGPMKERTFHIPDELVEEFLESDVDLVGRRYTRVMGADVELAGKFGSVDLKEQIATIRADYDRLRAGLTDEKELKRLGNREQADIRDLEAMRDLLRGTRREGPWDRGYATIARAANHFNYLRSMGEVVLASLTDAVRPAMVHGLRQFMTDVPKIALRSKGSKAAIEEAKLAGNIAERVLGHRLATITEIIDPYTSRGPTEKFLENMSNVASRWNGIRIWTDAMKSIASVMTQNRVLGNIENFAKVKGKEKSYMAYLGIDESMAERVAKLYAKHGETIDGVRVANTEKWTEGLSGAELDSARVAVRTFRAAINKDVNSIIVERSVADVPLFAHTPTGKMLLQFKSFALASHQKVLLRGLQEDKARFVSGMIAMTALGMMITWLKAYSGNRPETAEKAINNLGWWIGEGLDRAGIIAVPMEVANAFERIAGVNPIKSPLKVFDDKSQISQRMQNRNELGALLGPSYGTVQDAITTAGIPNTMLAGEDVKKGQKNAAERLLPFNSYVGVRQLMRYLVNPQH